MKKFILAALLAVLVGQPAGAQTISNIRPLTLAATLSAANAGTCSATTTACAVLLIGGYSGISVQVTGNASANTLQFETTIDAFPSASSVWVALNMTPPNSSTAVTSTTSTGIWSGGIAAAAVRVRMSTLVGGTAVVAIRATFGMARIGGAPSFPLAGAGGSCAAPAYAITGSLGTGLGSDTANAWFLSANGTCVLRGTDAAVTSTVPLVLPNSAFNAPSLVLDGDNSGPYRYGDNLIGWGLGGALEYIMSPTAFNFGVNSIGFGPDAESNDIALARLAVGTAAFSRTALGTTTSSALTLINTTAATGGATVQASPTFNLQGNAWDTAASQTLNWGFKVLPATAATPTSTLQFLHSLNGAANTTPMTLTNAGALEAASISGTTVMDSPTFRATAAGAFVWNGRITQRSSANALLNVLDNSEAFGIQFNTGTAAPTVGTCGTGTITDEAGTAGAARNTAGKVTATGATACTVTFGAPAWTNAPSCTLTMRNVPITLIYISAISTSAFTVSGLTANDVFTYHCIGRI